MSKLPKITQTKQLAQTRLFTVEQIHLQFSNGQERDYERIKGRAKAGSVMILPMLDAKTFLLVREYAAGIHDYLLAFPKGLVENGEDALATADRELKEEVGYGAEDLQVIKTFSSSPGYMSAKMQLVLAQNLYPATAEGDEPEAIEVVRWSIDKIDELLNHPEFHEARSIAALLLLERYWHV